MSITTNLYKKKGNKYIPGQFFRAFVWCRDYYVHSLLRVYADRTIAGNYLFYNLPINRLQKLIPMKLDKKQIYHFMGDGEIQFEDFKYLLRKKFVTFNYKGEVKIELCDEPITNTEDRYYLININENVSNNEYIKALEDVFCSLKNKQTSIRKCLNMLCEFLLAPKEKKEMFRKKLLKSYLDVPSFQRSKENPFYGLTIEMEAKAKSKTPVEDIIYKRKNRLDNYDDFVKVYDDGYFEAKYIEKQKLVFPNPQP